MSAVDRAAARRPLLPVRIDQLGLLVGIAALALLVGLVQPGFFSPGNLRDVLTQAAPLAIVVLGQTFVIIARGIDLSVGSLMASTAVLATAFESENDAMIPVIFAAAVLAGAVVGAINGWLVTRRAVSPFLATLAMMIMLQGLRFAWTQGAPTGTLPPGFRMLGTGAVAGVPINLLALGVLAVGLGWLLHVMPFGRRLVITGGNPRAARLVGINADRMTLLAYVICSITASLAGLFLVGYIGTVDSWVGRGYELDSIVAAVIGGVSLSGGRGGIPGALLGALVLVLLFNIVVILGLPVQAQFVVKGVIIIAAAALYRRAG